MAGTPGIGRGISSVSFSKTAWVKGLVHSLHHASGGVVGLLVGTMDGTACSVKDAAPLFHNAMSAPISEVALSAVDAWAVGNGNEIVGVYYADSVVAPRREAAERLALSLGTRLAAPEDPPAAAEAAEESTRIAKRTDLAMISKDTRVTPMVLARVCDEGIVPTDAEGGKVAEDPARAFHIAIVDKAGATPRAFSQDRFMVEEGAGGRLLADTIGVDATGPAGSEASRFRFSDFDDHLEDLSRSWTNEHIVA